MIRFPAAVVFDFDGVLAESNGVKVAAFEKLFAGYPECAERMRALYRKDPHRPRARHFEAFVRDGLGLSPDSDEGSKCIAEMAERFSNDVLEAVIASPDVKGARNLLEYLQGKCPLFIASTTPQVELDLIADKRGLRPYFEEIHGNPPTSKVEAVKRVRDRHGLGSEEVLFIGDSQADYDAARETGVRFWGRKSENVFEAEGVRWFADLDEMLGELRIQ